MDGRIQWWLFRFIYPVLALSLLVLSVVYLPGSWRAHQQEGTPGVFTVAEVDCGKSCTYQGRFVSTDGRLIRDPIELQPDLGVHYVVGQQVSTVDTGSPAVYPVDGGSAWLWWGTLGAGGAFCLSGWLWVMTSRSRRNFMRRAATAP